MAGAAAADDAGKKRESGRGDARAANLGCVRKAERRRWQLSAWYVVAR